MKWRQRREEGWCPEQGLSMHQRAGIQGPEGGLGSHRVRQSDSSVVEVLQGRMSRTHVSLWVEWKKAGEFLSHSSVLSVKLVPQTLYPTHLLNTHVQTLLQSGLSETLTSLGPHPGLACLPPSQALYVAHCSPSLPCWPRGVQYNVMLCACFPET